MPWKATEDPNDFPTLGWGVLEWMTAYLPSPADEHQPFVLTDEQARIILDWYAIDPLRGRFTYRRGQLELAKGWGKSPLVAAIALAEFTGPVLFDGWDANGQPVARQWGTKGDPPPLIQIAAVSEDQAENTYGALYQMLTARNGRTATDLRIDDGRTRLYLKGRPGSLTPVTASAGSREGQRLTFAVMDETHLWTPQNGGVKLAATLRRNAAKMHGRTIETTNAPVLGSKSVAEGSEEDAAAGKSGIYRVARRPATEPQPEWTDVQLLETLDYVYEGAYWVDTARLVDEVRDPRNDWLDSLRYYFNIRTSGSGRAVDPKVWDALARPGPQPADGTLIGLGFDGSVSRDGTVLMGCDADGRSFVIGMWVRPAGASPDWTVPRLEVHEAVARAFEHWKVGRMDCDPPYWRTEVEQWARQYGDKVVLALDTNQRHRFAPAVDRWLTGIREGTHTHDGDPFLADNVKSCRLERASMGDDSDPRTRYVIVKGEEGRRIDAAVADVLAYEAAMTMTPPVDTTSVYDRRGPRRLSDLREPATAR